MGRAVLSRVMGLTLGVLAATALPAWSQTFDPFLGQWIDAFGNIVPDPNSAPPAQPSQPSLPRLQPAPSLQLTSPQAANPQPFSQPPKPHLKGTLAFPAESTDATSNSVAIETSFGDELDSQGRQPDAPEDASLAAAPSEATAAVLDIEEPEPTGLLFTEPLGLLELGEGALVLDPALMEDEPSLEALLSGADREQRLKQLGLGDKIALLSTSEEAERKRNQVLFQRALQERDPPLPRRFARLRAMEKITARMTTIDVPVGQTVEFGTVQITPRVCYENPPTEPPESASFLEISDHPVSRDAYQVFNGWMFASSPALSAMDHPIYDVWVLRCLDIE